MLNRTAAAQDDQASPIFEARPSTAISALAVSLASLSIDDLSQTSRHSALRCILDQVGCAAAGRSTSFVNAVVDNGTRWARSAFPLGNASVWFNSARLSSLGAAFVNSLAASLLDLDDGHRTASGHPGAAVIPAVIAVAETIDARLQDVLLAIVCGYEAGVSVAAARKPSSLTTGATGRWSAVAVASAVGKLRGLSAGDLANAIAIAEAQAPNMAAADHAGFAGSHTKEGIPWSVLTGLIAVEHASLGFKGYLAGLDDPAAYRSGWIPRCTSDAFFIETTYFKPYACCRWTHSAIDAILALRNGLDPASVEQIEVASFQRALSLENRVRPNDIIAAQFSVPFVAAVALLDGAEALLPMSPSLLDRQDVIEMAKRVVMVLDGELDARYPAQVPARVTIRTRQGIITREVRTPLGDPANPLSDSQLIDKTARLCVDLRGKEAARHFAVNLLHSAEQSEIESLNALLNFIN